jgi:hypothetical protein
MQWHQHLPGIARSLSGILCQSKNKRFQGMLPASILCLKNVAEMCLQLLHVSDVSEAEEAVSRLLLQWIAKGMPSLR